jgi:hypothetical protein
MLGQIVEILFIKSINFIKNLKNVENSSFDSIMSFFKILLHL